MWSKSISSILCYRIKKKRRSSWTFYLTNTGLEDGERSGMLYNMLCESRMQVKMRVSTNFVDIPYVS